MFLVPINWLAILACGVAAMAIGFVWYGPLFGKEWMKLIGMTEKKMEATKKDITTTYTTSFAVSLLMAYALAHFIWFTAPGAVNVIIGVKTALWAWVGFVVTIAINNNLFAPVKKPTNLITIESGYYLVILVAMGAIIAIWP